MKMGSKSSVQVSGSQQALLHRRGRKSVCVCLSGHVCARVSVRVCARVHDNAINAAAESVRAFSFYLQVLMIQKTF